MQKVYENQNLALVWIARNIVAQSGVACIIRNEFASGAAGQLSPFDTWPELWVMEDLHAPRAKEMLRRALETDAGERDDWTCAQCREINAASFETCWKCGAACIPA